MPFWFEKENARRFRRLDISIKAVVRPQDSLKETPIFAYGIDYFPSSVQKRISKANKALCHWVSHIQEHQDILEPIFSDFERYIQFFGDWTSKLSQGQSPRVNSNDWLEFHGYAKGVRRIHSIDQAAPKTFQYFEALNDKMTMYFQHLSGCFESSNATTFKAPPPFLNDFVIDQKAKRFEPDTFQNVPLAQALYHLNALMTHYFNAYQNLVDDMTLSRTPQNWPKLELNLSEGGAAIFVPKRFCANERYKIIFYFDSFNRALEMPSVLVRSLYDQNRNLECNAFDFVFPNSHYQRLIQLEIDRYEITQSKKVYR